VRPPAAAEWLGSPAGAPHVQRGTIRSRARTTPAEIDLSVLPPEVRAAFEAERTRRRALEVDVAALAEHDRRLEHLVAEFRQVLYGKRSEKLIEDARQLAFEDLETDVAP